MCFSILLTQVHAQKESQESKISIDSMLVNIDKSTFTSGILYDRVTDWAALASFNDDAKNVSNSKHFEQALHELYKASNQQKFIYYKDLRKKYTKNKQQGVVDIGILNASFHQLNYNQENESKGGLLKKGAKFESIKGKSPFVEKHLFLVSPLRGYIKGQTITYKFNDSFLFDVATTKKIVSLTVDFDTNKKYAIYKNGVFTTKTIQIDYTKSGYKTLASTVVYADSTQQTTKAKLHVKVLDATMMRDPIVDGTKDSIHDSTIAFQGYSYDENETTPIYGKLEYRIFYHKDSNGAYERRLLKPIVIIDGFDPGDLRKIQDVDNNNPNISDEDHDSIEEMMEYVDSENRRHYIIEELRKPENGGYDVIIINHPNYTRGAKTINGGADYIERNGRAHASFYKELNATILANGSSEELVIVGPSMGGQVSRYALAYMEQKYEETNDVQWQHHVRLWVSIDSPHLGANVPLGTQSLLNMAAETGVVEAIGFVEGLLGSPAAKQQLIEQYNGYSGSNLKQDHLNAKTISQGYSENRGSQFFIDFYDNLYANGLDNSRGYPQNLRKIAIANGSITGSKKYKNPFKSNWYTLNENNGLRDDTYPDSKEKVLDITGVKVVLGPRIIGARLHSYAMPEFSGSGLLARFYKLKLAWAIPIVSTYDKHLFVTNNNSRGNMDNVSGGWFATQQQVAKTTIENMPSVLSWYELRKISHANSFIATPSSLGFKNPDFKWGEPIDTNLLCDDEIPFDTFFAPKDNERHTSFTETSVNWLFEELAGNEQSIPNYTNPTITGDPEVYTGQTVTYTIPKVAKATSYTWDLDFNYNTINYTPWSIISGQGTTSITVSAGSPIIGYISCRPKNSCGTGQLSYKAVRSYNSVGDGDGGDDDPCDNNYKLSISPNPNKGGVLTLTLAPDYPTDPCDDINPFKQQIKNTVEIYDIYGSKKYSGIYNSNEIFITGLRLKMGVYVVHLTTANGVKKEKKLMIE
ncbi:MAG: hypothetical protein COA67_09595 [Lutibacter sp.]|nr:MAG: hypothetical protein COA67_09595 [Lutibacter sp.]